MEILHNISPQQISWVKSNKKAFEQTDVKIANLYYPETINELKELLQIFYSNKERFTLIGYSSNTLFLPTFSAENLICTKKLNRWIETNDSIECECGVLVSSLSKEMIKKGCKGFEGLTDLPGTLAAAIYGNCGCRGCSVNDMVTSFELLTPQGEILTITPMDLKLSYRSTSLKRKELNGIILRAKLKKHVVDADELCKVAEQNHQIRKEQQPSAANNLGTTFNGGARLTIKGYCYKMLSSLVSILKHTNDGRIIFPLVLKLTGNSKYIPYVYYWNRYMFLDEKAHLLFADYYSFLKTMYKDVRLEIEIKE